MNTENKPNNEDDYNDCGCTDQNKIEIPEVNDSETKKLNNEDIDKYRELVLEALSSPDVSTPEKLMEYLQKNYSHNVPTLDRPKKILACSHEIVFNIRANVMEEDEKGEIVGCREICQKDYHIPVPPNKDYNMYMETFFRYLEHCITSSAKKSMQETKDK